MYGLLILLVVGVVVGYQLYRMRQANIRAGESLQKQAEMLEKTHGQ